MNAYLKMWTRNTASNLPKERLLNTRKLRRLNDVEHLLDLAEEHHLLLATRLRPESEQAAHHWLR